MTKTLKLGEKRKKNYKMIPIYLILIFIFIQFSHQQTPDPEYRRRLDPSRFHCHSKPFRADDRRINKNELSIMTLNAEWLFRNGGVGEKIKCPSKDCPWRDGTKAHTHLLKIVEIIGANNFPDIVNLIEVEDCNVLQILIAAIDNQYGVSSGYRAYLKPGTDFITGQQIGMIAKVDPIADLKRSTENSHFPIPNSQCGYKSVKGKVGVSKHYYTTFKINNKIINLVGVHLISVPNAPEKCAKREAQALTIRRIIDDVQNQTPGSETIVLGDFNDFDRDIESPTSRFERPRSKVFDIIKSTNPSLINVARFSPNKYSRYSFWLDRNGNCEDDGHIEHSLIDHVLISAGLVPNILESRAFHGYKVNCKSFYPDHFPLYVKFDTTSWN